MDRNESRDGSAEAEEPGFLRYALLLLGAHGLGSLACLTLWLRMRDAGDLAAVAATSGGIFAIGMVLSAAAFGCFRIAVVRERAAQAMYAAAAGDEDVRDAARMAQERAVRTARNGYKPLMFSGVCLVVSPLIALSSLLGN